MRRKFLTGLCAFALLLAMFPAAVRADASEESAGIGSRADGFSAYWGEIAGQPAASSPLVLEAADAALSPTVAPASEEGAVSLEEDTSMEWTFSVETGAVYELVLSYAAVSENGRPPQIRIELDGAVPYTEVSDYELSLVYQDAGPIEQNSKGDDRIPEQLEVERWQERRLPDTSGLTGQPLSLYLEEGEHTLRFLCTRGTVRVSSLTLAVPETVKPDDEARQEYEQNGLQEIDGFYQVIQAEAAWEKSDSTLYPTYDRTSPATEPYDAVRIRRNTIGKGTWSEPGMWISYRITDVPADGLYYLTIKYRQAEAIGVTSYRDIYINGEIQSAAFQNVAFPYGVDWERQTISDGDDVPLPIYLKEGENELRLEVSLGPAADAMRMVDESVYALNQLYTQIVMITGTSPDPYRDYYLDQEIPGLLEDFQAQADLLYAANAALEQWEGETAGQNEDILGMARRLESMIDDPRSIPDRISSFREGISALSTWLYDRASQPLEMDYLIVHSSDSELPSPHAGLWAQIVHFFRTFFASFVEDYNAVGGTSSGESIKVWANIGRDQVQVIKDLVDDSFTPETGISVNLSIVQSGFIEATLAGRGPDVAIGIARGQPVNLACRNALLDFDSYEGFEEMSGRFADTALVPYQYQGKTYAIPCTQTFYMLFYRKDILAQLGVEPPETWDDLMEIVPRLQRSHMTIGLPYAVISAAAAVDNGLGAKDLFATLLLQNGGTFYNEDYTATALDSEAAVSAFRQWCEFYTKYGFDLVYDFYTRFSTGEMPIGIASYEMFNTLSVAAKEIQGLWGMAPVPGTVQPDGSINTQEAGAGTAAVIFKKTDSPESCYQFVDWWTSDEIQNRFCTSVENILGPGGRHATANLDAFSRQPWTDEELAMLSAQRNHVVELPEIPGSYYVSRSIDNAFRAVLYDGKNPREVFERENRNINQEIARKRRELGLSN